MPTTGTRVAPSVPTTKKREKARWSLSPYRPNNTSTNACNATRLPTKTNPPQAAAMFT